MQLSNFCPKILWNERCRSDYNLTPSQLGTLVAIVLFYALAERPITLEELYAFGSQVAGDHPVDPMRAVSSLFKEGLVERIGPPHSRLYMPTLAGLRRVEVRSWEAEDEELEVAS